MSILKPPLPGNLTGYRVNKTLHGRSVHRKRDVPGHNVVMGYSRPGTGDGVDLFCAAGTPVYTMHAGHVNRIADRGGRLSCVYVAWHGYTTIYAHMHLKNSLQIGDGVGVGECLGWVDKQLSDPHLHLEVWHGGKVVSSNTPAGLAAKIKALLLP